MVDETEEEQIKAIKDWWGENGTSLIVSIVLAVGGVFGYQAWQNNVRETGEAASAVYEDFVQAREQIVPGSEDAAMVTTAKSLAGTLKSDYADSTYAVFAALHLAKIAVDEGELVTARDELSWALDKKLEPVIEAVVRMRLARVLVALAEPDAALAVLNMKLNNKAQLSSWEEAKGDVYTALGDFASARTAYQTALDNVEADVNKPLLNIKLADIPKVNTGLTTATENKSADGTTEAGAAPVDASDAPTADDDA